ncbi:hypothetical protein GCM10023194_41890 [Planotetraspora phitsanulokensis]|uniref:FMN-binding domain-containing protein n=1 Tax=Planotetraspora phitsanulokensis TaxID=575192 RepID=A0A8J3U8Y8_9ACTN|nr:FMN-binding protein [Planotetraspora phitsanulokensis]GII40823.1 hypothetical protein Pph01_58260 [Planotetraspora phitsanulokensis]
MRRAIFAVIVTATGLVLLLSFKPHNVTAAAERPGVVSDPPAGDANGQAEAPATSGKKGTGTGKGTASGTDKGKGTASGAGKAAPKVTASPGSWSGDGASLGETAGEKVVGGAVADTRFGPVQVQLVLSDAKITGVQVLQAPQESRRDFSINSEALPILDQEALAAQSAQIDTVSGATYTSDGYVQSLQSALDRAGL